MVEISIDSYPSPRNGIPVHIACCYYAEKGWMIVLTCNHDIDTVAQVFEA